MRLALFWCSEHSGIPAHHLTSEKPKSLMAHKPVSTTEEDQGTLFNHALQPNLRKPSVHVRQLNPDPADTNTRLNTGPGYQDMVSCRENLWNEQAALPYNFLSYFHFKRFINEIFHVVFGVLRF